MKRIRAAKITGKPQTLDDLVRNGVVIVGSPNTVREKLAEYQDLAGFNTSLTKTQFGTHGRRHDARQHGGDRRGDPAALPRSAAARQAAGRGGVTHAYEIGGDDEKLPRREFLRLAGLAAASSIVSRPAFAQAYPARPVRLVVPFNAGGSTDLIGRIMCQWLTERLGQSFVVENKPGGGTNIATQLVVNSPPDGYTLLYTVSTHTINPSLYKSLPFDFQRDIVAGCGPRRTAAGAGDEPAGAGQDRRRVHRLCQGQSGQGQHGLVRRAHHQPSDHRAHQDLDRHRIRSRALHRRLGDADRPDLRPDPGRRRCAAELAAAHQERRGARARRPVAGDGLRRCRTCRPWASSSRDSKSPHGTGVGAPKGTPPEIVERLNREINAGLQDAALLKRFADVGGVPIRVTPPRWRAMIAKNTDKWAKVVKAAGLQPE